MAWAELKNTDPKTAFHRLHPHPAPLSISNCSHGISQEEGEEEDLSSFKECFVQLLYHTLLIHAFYAVSWVNRSNSTPTRRIYQFSITSLRLHSFLHRTSNTSLISPDMKNQKLQLGAKLSRRTRRRRSLKHRKLLQGVSKWLGNGLRRIRKLICAYHPVWCMNGYIFPLPLLGNVEPRL